MLVIKCVSDSHENTPFVSRARSDEVGPDSGERPNEQEVVDSNRRRTRMRRNADINKKWIELKRVNAGGTQ